MRALPVTGSAHGRRWWKSARWVLAVVVGLLWWWAVLRLAVRPETARSWQGAAAMAGWTLGLIPLHAVPAGAAQAVSRRRALGRAGSAGTSTPPGSQPPDRAART